jgi:hypothetical protein
MIDSRQQPVTSSYALMQQMVITASQAQIHNQNIMLQQAARGKAEKTVL